MLLLNINCYYYNQLNIFQNLGYLKNTLSPKDLIWFFSFWNLIRGHNQNIACIFILIYKILLFYCLLILFFLLFHIFSKLDPLVKVYFLNILNFEIDLVDYNNSNWYLIIEIDYFIFSLFTIFTIWTSYYIVILKFNDLYTNIRIIDSP